jgi:hypothetical protein
MKDITLKLPMFGFIVATRAMIGAGIGLLVSQKLSDAQRRTLGVTLLSIGAAATIPAIAAIIRGRHDSDSVAA